MICVAGAQSALRNLRSGAEGRGRSAICVAGRGGGESGAAPPVAQRTPAAQLPEMAAEPGTSEVRRQHRFDACRLERLLCRRLAGFPQQPEGALEVRQYR